MKESVRFAEEAFPAAKKRVSVLRWRRRPHKEPCREPRGDDRTAHKFVAPEFVFGPGSARLAGRNRQEPAVSRRPWWSPVRTSSVWGGPGRSSDSLRRGRRGHPIFADITPNPRDYEVMAGAGVYRREGCDAIVAVGGGSPMDCAKAIGIVCANDRHVLEFEGVDNVERPGPPLICVPTTAGTGAEVSQFAIINDTKRKVKIAIVSKTVIPDAALSEPLPTMTMDAELTAHTGLDALTHAIEAYVSNAHSPITDLFALKAVELVQAHLVAATARPDDIESRSGMMFASLYAGLAFSNAILGAVHAMAHSLGGFLGPAPRPMHRHPARPCGGLQLPERPRTLRGHRTAPRGGRRPGPGPGRKKGCRDRGPAPPEKRGRRGPDPKRPGRAAPRTRRTVGQGHKRPLHAQQPPPTLGRGHPKPV